MKGRREAAEEEAAGWEGAGARPCLKGEGMLVKKKHKKNQRYKKVKISSPGMLKN